MFDGPFPAMVCACAELSIVLAAFDSATDSTMPKRRSRRSRTRKEKKMKYREKKLREAAAGPEDGPPGWTGSGQTAGYPTAPSVAAAPTAQPAQHHAL